MQFIKIKNNTYAIEVLVGLVVFGLALYTNPQLELYLDASFHLSVVMHLLHGHPAYAYSPSFYVPRHLWHLMWAFVLKPFYPLPALIIYKIIYTVQFCITMWLYYLATRHILNAFFRQISNYSSIVISFCAMFMTLFTSALLGFSWYSMYMVSYWITIPIAAYLCCLSLDCFENNVVNKWIVLRGIICLILIAAFHAFELAFVFIWWFVIIIFYFNKIPSKALLGCVIVIGIILILLPHIPILSVHYTSYAEYKNIFEKDSSNIILPVTELVKVFLIAGGVLLLLSLLFARRLQLKTRPILLTMLLSLGLTYFSLNKPVRELLFFVSPALTSRMVYASIWYAYIPILIYIVLHRIKYELLRNALIIFGVITVSYQVFQYSRTHDELLSKVAIRLWVSHDPDYISAMRYSDFRKAENYINAPACGNILFIARQDIAAAIGMMGCYANFDYNTFITMNSQLLEQYRLHYKTESVPDLFNWGENPKYNQMWNMH